MAHMSQAEIDALLKDSMFQDSEIQEHKASDIEIQNKQPQTNNPTPEPNPTESQRYGKDSQHYGRESQNYASEDFESYEESRRKEDKKFEESQNYTNEEFQSYEESRKTFTKNTKTVQNQKRQPQKAKLADIKEEASPQTTSKQRKWQQKPKSKTGIYFYPVPPKPSSPVPKDSGKGGLQKKHLPHNYARLQQKQRQLLLTSLSEENIRLKEEVRRKEGDYKRLQSTYRDLVQDKAKQAVSIREITLEKKLAALQSKHEKMENLYKLERERNKIKSTGKTHPQTFLPEEQVSQREQELLDLIDQLKERLISSNTELKTLQKKMNEGEDYIEELKRKMKRVEQLEFKMEKMAEQAENDREYIKQLRQKNSSLETQLFDLHKEKRLMDVEVRRYQLGQETQKDTLAELEEVRKEKNLLERTLRDFAGNMNNYSKKNSQGWTRIEDSGELLKP